MKVKVTCKEPAKSYEYKIRHNQTQHIPRCGYNIRRTVITRHKKEDYLLGKREMSTTIEVTSTKRTTIILVTYENAFLLSAAKLSLRKGINAEVSAPSAKKALKRLGMAYATKKASVTAFAPKKAATAISLISPKMRLVNIPKDDFITLLKKTDTKSACTIQLIEKIA